jgi:hypothetical protein
MAMKNRTTSPAAIVSPAAVAAREAEAARAAFVASADVVNDILPTCPRTRAKMSDMGLPISDAKALGFEELMKVKALAFEEMQDQIVALRRRKMALDEELALQEGSAFYEQHVTRLVSNCGLSKRQAHYRASRELPSEKQAWLACAPRPDARRQTGPTRR